MTQNGSNTERDRIHNCLIDAIQIQIGDYINQGYRDSFLTSLSALLAFGEIAFGRERGDLLKDAFEYRLENWWAKKHLSADEFKQYRTFFCEKWM